MYFRIIVLEKRVRDLTTARDKTRGQVLYNSYSQRIREQHEEIAFMKRVILWAERGCVE